MQRVIPVPAYVAGDTSGPNGTNGTVVQLVGPSADRKRFRCINIGAALANYGFDVTQVAPGNGWPLEPAGTIGGQGGGDDPVQNYGGAIFVAAAAPTKIVVQVFH